jgi:hypothetical protein
MPNPYRKPHRAALTTDLFWGEKGIGVQTPRNYNLKACILRRKTMGFASQYAAYCRPKCRVLQNKAVCFVCQNKLKEKAVVL